MTSTSFDKNSKETCQLRNGGIENFRIDALIVGWIVWSYIPLVPHEAVPEVSKGNLSIYIYL